MRSSLKRPIVAGSLAIAIAGAALLPRAVFAKSMRVTIAVPMPSRIEMNGLRKILVTRFVVQKELPEVDLNREIVGLLRRELRKKTNLEILEVEPTPLPEQPLADLLANTGFWRKLAAASDADLVVSGEVNFSVSDRSGFVQQDEISPLTGQRVRRTRFVDREGFSLDMHLFFLRGATGKILYEDHFTGENTLPGKSNDRLTALFSIFEQFENDVLAIVAPEPKTAQRNLFTD